VRHSAFEWDPLRRECWLEEFTYEPNKSLRPPLSVSEEAVIFLATNLPKSALRPVCAKPKGLSPFGHPGIFGGRPIRRHPADNDAWIWPKCGRCSSPPGQDRIRRVGHHNLCYACLDVVKYCVAEKIRFVLARIMPLQLFDIPSELRILIANKLYILLLLFINHQ
jgi:hypothetical protein